MFALMLAAAAPAALAQQATNANPQQPAPNAQVDPQAAPNAEAHRQAAPDAQTSPELEAMMKLQAFAKTLDDAGFKEVQVLPQAVLVSGKDKSDKPVMLIFDTQSMTAVQVQPTHQSETTGSGSAEDKNPGGNTNAGRDKNPGSDTNPGR
jgi:hypothetical protein